MSRKKHRKTTEWKWEQALIDAYYDYRWRQVLDSLYAAKFKRWEVGELTHHDMDQAIHETHKENQYLYSLFNESRSFLVGVIQWDEEWFERWLVDHPPPPGVELTPRRARPSSNGEETTPNEGVFNCAWGQPMSWKPGRKWPIWNASRHVPSVLSLRILAEGCVADRNRLF